MGWVGLGCEGMRDLSLEFWGEMLDVRATGPSG